MSVKIVRGGTLLIESGPRSHLFVALDDACPARQHAMVSFSTIKGDKSDDLTCVFEVAEVGHPFIKVRSFMFYRSPMVRDAAHIGDCIAKKTFIVREAVSIDVTDRIINGAFDSKFTPNYFKTYLNGLPTR
jgi:hypothetical protein